MQIDGEVYDVLAHIRRKETGSFVYDIEMYENKNIEPSSPEDSLKSGRNRVPNGSKLSIRNSVPEVKKKLSDRDPGNLDLDYMDAINRSDIKTAQQMVDEAAKQWGAFLNNADANGVFRQNGEVLFYAGLRKPK